MPTAARIGESRTTPRGSSYVPLNLIGTILCESSIIQLNQVTSSLSIHSIRAKLRAFNEDFDWLSSYHSRCFYANYKANVSQLESGYLKSTLLIKVRCFSLNIYFILSVFTGL